MYDLDCFIQADQFIGKFEVKLEGIPTKHYCVFISIRYVYVIYCMCVVDWIECIKWNYNQNCE